MLRRGSKNFLLMGLAAIFLLGSCARENLRVGFIAGLSGKFADLGTGGRNGAMLAVEQRNARGGIRGRQVELVYRDDRQDPVLARKAINELADEKLVAVIGPMTSSMATAIVPEANRRGLLLMGGSVTTTALSGQDDFFFRVMGDTRLPATNAARYHLGKLGVHRVAAIIDTSNRDHSADWINHYRQSLEAGGGQLITLLEADLRRERDYAMFARKLLASSPDLVVFGCNAMDTAMLVPCTLR